MNLFQKTFVVVLALALLVPTAATAGSSKKRKTKNVNVTLMTRNLYLGADIIKLVGATDRDDFKQKATALFETVGRTDFRSRAPLIADEIRRTKPDFVGLQEVALWRRGADGVDDGSTTPSTTVVYDWLADLRKALKDEGLRYRVVRKQVEFDFEGPTSRGHDIRFTQQDAILMRVSKKVKARKIRSGNFDSSFQVGLPSIGQTADVKRGFVSLDGTVNGAKFRFVNTHLEAYNEANGLAQAQELTKRGGPARYRGQTFLVGDMNSARNADDSDPIDHLLGFGFGDSFFRKTKRNVFTCCQPEEINNPESQLASRIDYVLDKPKRKIVSSKVVGNNPNIKTSSGLWPSDHAGVVTKFRMKVKR
jgi:endonuclease/exonuclease/phosphatase family metal-dependent hydrolase